MQVLRLDTLTLLRLVHANVGKQVNNGVARGVKSHGKVILLANEFNRVFSKKSDILVSHFHNGNNNLLQDVGNVRFKGFHSSLLLSSLTAELDSVVHSLGSSKCISLEKDLKVGVEESSVATFKESLAKININFFLEFRVTIF